MTDDDRAWPSARDWAMTAARRAAIIDRMSAHGLLPQDEVFVHEPTDEELLDEPFVELQYAESICFNTRTGTLSILGYTDGLFANDFELKITAEQLSVFHAMYMDVYENHMRNVFVHDNDDDDDDDDDDDNETGDNDD